MQKWPLRSYLELRAVPESVRLARAHTRNVVGEWRLGVLVDTAELIVSEITTNAVRASARIAVPCDESGPVADGPRIRLWLTSDSHSVLVQVWDGDHRRPRGQVPPPDAESGRGLLLVEALSTQYGCCAGDGHDGKIIWAVCSQDTPPDVG